jgi:hypothetical protein
VIGDVTDSLMFLFSLPFVVGGLGAVTGQEHGKGHSQGTFSLSLVVFEGVGPSGSGGSGCSTKVVLSLGFSVSFDLVGGIVDGVLLESFFITYPVGGLINWLVGWLVGWASRK